ncbi:sugar transferase [Saccharopolyspora erythraea]|nr:sugar transferase [Saccharopolyspora erythraea]
MQEPMRTPLVLPGGIGARGAVRTPVLAPPPPRPAPASAHSTVWERWYRVAVVVSDLLATLLACGSGTVLAIAFGLSAGPRTAILAVLASSVVLCSLSGSWSPRILGEGPEEYRRVGRGVFAAGVALAVPGLAFPSWDVRLWVFGVLPLLAVLAVLQRYLLRRYLHRARGTGRCLLPVIAAGDPRTLRDLVERTRLQPHVGWRIEALCVPAATAGQVSEIEGIPVVGDVEGLAGHVRRGGYRVVAVTADQHWTPRRLQRLAWELEDTPAEMVVAPVLMEVAGPRLHVSSVLGMPLLRVSAPVFNGARRIIKSLADWVSALLLLVLLAPALLVIAAVVKATDGGPVVYRQRRIGRNGTTFTMLKFRSMVVDADAQLSRLRASNEADGPLFKLRRDPRVTRIGAVLRRYSLDELPQLFNVLTGQMSLVGPRPPLPEESDAYDSEVRRRLLVKPGLTGLWQVSGRSDLSWAESIRLDLRYVENWSLALDAVILWKTVRAVLKKQGAY